MENELGESQITPLSDEVIREFYHSVNDAVFVHDAETGEILDVNETMCDMYGYSRAEARQLSIEDLSSGIHPYTQDTAVDYVQKAAKGNPQIFDWHAEDSEGNHFWVEVSMRCAVIDDQNLVLVIVRDITERHEREQQLEALSRTAQVLMSAETRDEVVEIGVETTQDILGINANSIHLYDEDADALVPVAATDAVYDLIGDPPIFTGDDSIAWRVYQRGEPLAVDDVHEDPDRYNTETPVRSELFLPLDRYGILIAGSSSPETFDEQDTLLAEILAGALATAMEQVQQTEQLRVRERELIKQNARLEEFASIVSHDLRNPLGVASGRLELASEECDSEHIEHVERAHGRIRALIEDLLTLAREGETVTDLEPVALAPLIEGCWANVETAEAMLVTEVERTIQADKSRLKQLFENLMRNAVEHGGEDVSVTVGGLDDGFYIEDDGPGIPADEREHIFEAGYSTSEDGTGFGLSIVKQIIEAHDWRIRVTDGAEGGVRFEITAVEFTIE